ncbi:MAG: hypothetical protein CMJ62_02180 [Planctomycetaceae bacterium]|nr:hypothetical protein [Planctomycetaceae bacterium]
MIRTVFSISVFGVGLVVGNDWLSESGSSVLAAASVKQVNEELVSNVTGDDEAAKASVRKVSGSEDSAGDPLSATDEEKPGPTSLDKSTPKTAQVPSGKAVAPEGSRKVVPPDEKSGEAVPKAKSKKKKSGGANSPLSVARSPKMRQLRNKIENVLEIYYRRHLNSKEHCPWAIMHSFIAYGVDTQVRLHRPGGRRMNAIGLLCYNGRTAGQQIFYLSDGQLRTKTGPGVQGHEGQFLAMLAQSRVQSDYPLRVGGVEFSVSDLIEYEKTTCYAGTELTFKLIALVHYLPTDCQWTNDRGENWDFQRLVQEELAQPVRGAACGGTHRLMGLSYAVRTRENQDGEFIGEWQRAKQFVEEYHKYAFSLQNRDGSFSSNWFKGRGNWGDVHRKIETTGHTLEWLVYSLPRERLGDSRVVKSVDYLASLLKNNRYVDFKVGPRGHGLHALALYEHRVFGKPFGQRRQRFARRNRRAAKK